MDAQGSADLAILPGDLASPSSCELCALGTSTPTFSALVYLSPGIEGEE